MAISLFICDVGGRFGGNVIFKKMFYRKKRRLEHFIPSTLVPFALEDTGALSSTASKTIGHVVKTGVVFCGSVGSLPSRCWKENILQRLSTTVQRSNALLFAMVLGEARRSSARALKDISRADRDLSD